MRGTPLFRRAAVVALAASASALSLPAARAGLVGVTSGGAAHAAFVAPQPATVTSSQPQPGGAGYTATLMHFTVHVGPGSATACDIIGELFMPTSASATAPVPAILTTNGFGGSYQGQVDIAQHEVGRGYAVLTYSGLGFGGSGCNIELDDPAWDGAAASQLISYLGSLPQIVSDGTDDPRVGMIGGSYGGDVQFSTAAVDPRLDTIIPVITWNDLAYSLAPNNDAPPLGYVHTDAEPGVEKIDWASLFFADGMAQVPQHSSATPVPPSTCPGFDPSICTAYFSSAALGYTSADTVALLRHTSMVSYFNQLRAGLPVMLMQGEGDSLFNINEAAANYELLKGAGDSVKLVIQSWGHSQGTPAPGEVSYTDPSKGYETVLVDDWFDKWLKNATVATGPEVEYFRDWVSYDTAGTAEPAYGTAGAWPVGSSERFYLSGDGTLASSAGAVVAGAAHIVNSAGVPGSYSETSGAQTMSPFSGIAPTDAPGTYAAWTTAPVASDTDSVGIPLVTFKLSSTSPAGVNPASDPVLFGKLYDVAPDGTVTLVQRLVSPLRVADLSQPVTLTLPGVVHRYAAGHRIELVLAATDAAYVGSRVPAVMTVAIDPSSPPTLDLPVVDPAAELSGGTRATGG